MRGLSPTCLFPASCISAYRKVVLVQQLSEMEEIVQYQSLCATASRETAHDYITHLRKMWAARLRGCQRNVDVRDDQVSCPYSRPGGVGFGRSLCCWYL